MKITVTLGGITETEEVSDHEPFIRRILDNFLDTRGVVEQMVAMCNHAAKDMWFERVIRPGAELSELKDLDPYDEREGKPKQ